MATSIGQSIESLVTCVLCFDLFDDPRLLPCSHTYCRKCITKHASANGGQFSCPLRDGCSVTASQINSLPVNRHVRDLVEVHRKFKWESMLVDLCACENRWILLGSVGHLVVRTATTRSAIDPCKDHPDQRVKYWCLACARSLCAECILLEHKNHSFELISAVAGKVKDKVSICRRLVTDSRAVFH